jgi:predicted membrane protein
MAKKLFYKLSLSLQMLLLIAAFGLQYFSVKKMGMMRYMVYINSELPQHYPVTEIKYAITALLAFLAFTSLTAFGAAKKIELESSMAMPMLVLQLIMTVALIVFALGFSPESYRSYFFTGPILALVALIQEINFLVYLKR